MPPAVTPMLAALIILTASLPSVRGQQFCTAGYYVTGQRAKVTCHFRHESTLNSIYVMRADLRAPQDSSDGKQVALCHFSPTSAPACETQSGYVVSNSSTASSGSLSVDLPAVTAELEGRYSCHLIHTSSPPPSSEGDVHKCLLVVQGKDQGEDQDHPLSEKTDSLQATQTATLCLVVILILLAVIAALLYLAYKNRKFPFRKKTTRLEDTQLPTLSPTDNAFNPDHPTTSAGALATASGGHKKAGGAGPEVAGNVPESMGEVVAVQMPRAEPEKTSLLSAGAPTVGEPGGVTSAVENAEKASLLLGAGTAAREPGEDTCTVKTEPAGKKACAVM